MRIISFLTFSIFIAVGSVSAGWIDIPLDNPSISSVPVLNGYGPAELDHDSYQDNSVLVDYPTTGYLATGYLATGSLDSTETRSFSHFDSLPWSESIWVGSDTPLEGIAGQESLFLFSEGEQSDAGSSLLTTGTVLLQKGPAGEGYSPKRLKMPEPLSMIVWAILGAAWAGLAWHRRPTHRAPQWSGSPVEEGDRWSKQNRQAILDVINKNRD